MDKVLKQVNKYLHHNDLFDKVVCLGSTKSKCEIQINYGEYVYHLIKIIDKYNKYISTFLNIDKKTNTAKITFLYMYNTAELNKEIA